MAKAPTPTQILKAARDIRDKRIALRDLEEDLLLSIAQLGGLEQLPDSFLGKLLDMAGMDHGGSLWMDLYRERERRKSQPIERRMRLLTHEGAA